MAGFVPDRPDVQIGTIFYESTENTIVIKVIKQFFCDTRTINQKRMTMAQPCKFLPFALYFVSILREQSLDRSPGHTDPP